LPYRIEYTEEARGHLRDLMAAQRSLILDSVETHLVHQPTVATRNRKELQSNVLARWEPRVRNLRVIYDVFAEPETVVSVRAIGLKVGNKLFIAGEEIVL
jgi:mRNA-degrading endonuclease RelE of RelBE toxin-antitoxin system